MLSVSQKLGVPSEVTEEMPQELRVHSVPAEDHYLVPSTNIRQLTTPGTQAPLLASRGTPHIHVHICTYTEIINEVHIF